MFQFRRYPSYDYFIHRTILEYCSSVLPHSDISGSTLICSSPKLFAACHVLHRLLMPRHSPCALFSLTYVEANYAPLRPSQARNIRFAPFPSPFQIKVFALIWFEDETFSFLQHHRQKSIIGSRFYIDYLELCRLYRSLISKLYLP